MGVRQDSTLGGLLGVSNVSFLDYIYRWVDKWTTFLIILLESLCPPMPAAFEGSSFLLTYPQSDFSLSDFQTHLQSLPDYKYSLISSEKHADNSLHRHAVIYFSKRQRLSSSFFDYLDRHPNVKPVGKKVTDWTNCTTYVRKDGDFLEDGVPRHERSVWSQVANAKSRNEALQLIREEKPRDFVLQRRNIDYFLDSVLPVQETPSYIGRSIDEFILPDSLQDWILESFRYVLTLRSEAINNGPSGHPRLRRP